MSYAPTHTSHGPITAEAPKRPPTVLLIDDEAAARKAIKRLLRHEELEVIEAADGYVALAVSRGRPVDMILLDLRMPTMDGYAFLKRLRANEDINAVPVCVLSALDDDRARRRAVALGADAFLHKSIGRAELRKYLAGLLRIGRQRRLVSMVGAELLQVAKHAAWQLDSLPLAVLESCKDIGLSHNELILLLAEAARLKDARRAPHVQRVAQYSALLAHRAGWPEHRVETLAQAALLHDLGTIGIPEQVLHKYTVSATEDLELAKHYVPIGAALLAQADCLPLRTAREVILSHREHYDGTGFPRGLSGDRIPITGRMVAIADIFDCIMIRVSPQDSPALDTAIGQLRDLTGIHVDPQLLEIFLGEPEALLRIHHTHPGTRTRTQFCSRFIPASPAAP